MNARHRSAILLGLLAVALFVARWPMDNTISSYKTWGAYRPTPTEGTNFFTSIFRGGGGTPAIFAMLGGQRYMVANIMWQYSDVLMHQGKIYDMVYPMESTVTLNPSFTDAWSNYGWHLAWNIYSDAKAPLDKQKWQSAGQAVFLRAIKTNPEKPLHRFDLAWFYTQREGNYRKALNVLLPVVEKGIPLTPKRKADPTNMDVINERCWEVRDTGHLLGITYLNLCIYTGDWEYLKKAVAAYRLCASIDPKANARYTDIANRYESLMYNDAWLKQSQAEKTQVRFNFGLPKITMGQSIEEIFPNGNPGNIPEYVGPKQ